MANDFDVNAFLDGLMKDRSKKNDFSGDRINKMLMNTKDNKGVCMFVIFKNQANGNFYTKVQDVKEIKFYNSKLDSEVWYKILPKEFYGDLSEEDSKLYDEVVSYWQQLKDWDAFDWNQQRKRSYALIYGHILKHLNESNQEVDGSKDSPALLIYPSNAVIDSIGDAINSKIAALNGNRDWIFDVLSDEPTNRIAAFVINFTGGQGGYDAKVSFEFNSSYQFIVPKDADYSADKEKFKDALADFLGWMNPEDHNGYFNKEIFSELRLHLLSHVAPEQAPDPENKPEMGVGNDQTVDQTQKSEGVVLKQGTGAPF